MASAPQYPAWAYMIAGVAIGLFVSFLVYLHNLPKPDTELTHKPDPSKPAPKFEFYDILPELEVVVPELGVLKNKAPSKTEATPPRPTTELNTGEQFVLQAGSFKDHKQADKLKATLILLGLDAFIQQVTVDNKSWHRVRIGPFTDQHTLNSARRRLQDNDIKAITLKVSG